ncbi:MAG: glycosyltransferase family 39 protein [Planctomycetota bacterium]|nr:glycosyltransferase family 39 protein [Planctomycetota bacterium]
MSTEASAPLVQARPRGSLLAATWALVGLGVVLLAILSQQVERTPDEANYQLSGRRLVAGAPPDRLEDRFQGPLIYLGTQLTDAGGKLTDDAVLRRARLGMLVFPALLLVVLAFWTRAALGPRAGCLAAALGAINPSLLAYGPLLSSDVAFTATAMLAGYCLWRWMQRPGLLRLLAVGLAVGMLVATKYTAALTVASLALVVLGHVVFGFDPWRPGVWSAPRSLGRRLGGAAGAFLVVGVVALGALYAAYLFTVAPLSEAALEGLSSGVMRALRELPGGDLVLRALPETLVVGVDFQAQWAGKEGLGSFGDLRGSHPAYYPLTLLVKTPEAVWALAALSIFSLRVFAAERRLWSTALLPPLLLLGYCSATSALQMGVRYVLPMVPALLMLASAFAGRRQRWGPISKVLVAGLLGASLWPVATGWPHFVGYFNAVSGGQSRGFRVVADGNCAWGRQTRETGAAALLKRHPDLEVLGRSAGPRFGRFAVWWADLKTPDPRAPERRCYHWLTRFTPFDHEGAGWLAFEVSAQHFDRFIGAGSSRAAVDLAMAWLRQGRYDEARAALTRAGPLDPAAEQARAWIDQFEAAGDDGAARDSLAVSLSEAGRYDLALSLIDRSRRTNAVLVYWLLWRGGRQTEAIEHLDRAGAGGSRTTEEVGLLALSLYNGGDDYAPDPMRALRYMQKHIQDGNAPAPGTPEAASWQGLLASVEAAVARERQLEGLR